MKQRSAVMLAAVLGTATTVRAQPVPQPSAPSGPGAPATPPGTPPRGTADAGGPTLPPDSPADSPVDSTADSPVDPTVDSTARPAVDPTVGPTVGPAVDPMVDPYARPARPAATPPALPRPAIDFPEVLRVPTGWLLPAGVLYSRSAIDTGGGLSSDARVGLGDVAEFGVATTDQVRERVEVNGKATRIQPYVTASFRLGVAENRLFANQPGVTLGFRKSFERNHLGYKTRIAELTLVASKHLGQRLALHLGGALWDASLQSTAPTAPGEAAPPEVTLHGNGTRNQLRVFGGLEAKPLPRSSILIDLSWAPEFCYACVDDGELRRIRLRPELAWGVRYEVASYMHLEAGVRVPDIGNFNLLDAQIFGQLTLTSFALKRTVDELNDAVGR